MNEFSQFGQRLFNTPLMLREDKCEVLAAALLDHFGVAKMDRLDSSTLGVVEMRQEIAAYSMGGQQDRGNAPYALIDGVAILPIRNFLAQRTSHDWGWVTGYNQVERKLEWAMADSEVRAILLDVDSPGGEVSGCFDLARKIAEYSSRNGGKPIVGAVNEQACSAAYALISGADEIYMPESGTAGSIGVWTMLVDLTRALDQDGLSVTIIRAGDRKARGGPYEKADKKTVEKLISFVEATRQNFAALVAENRRIPIDDVLAQEGDWYHGDETLSQRLIDGFGSFEAIFERARKLAA